jgi:alpha-glucosidase
MKKVFLIIQTIIICNMAYADFEFAADIISYNKFDDRVEFRLTNAKFNLYIIDKNIVRFHFTNKENFSPAPSYAVIYNVEKIPGFTFQDGGDKFLISTEELVVEITKSPCRVSIYNKEMELLNEDYKSFGVSFDGDEVRCHKTLFDDEKFYGLGEKTSGLNKRGSQYTMWNSDIPGYTKNTDPLYVSVPFFIGVRNYKAYGIFLDNTYKSYFNMGASNNRFYWFGAEKGELDYYLIYGPEIKKVISSFTLLTGRTELPPMWALGYQQSKWSYTPESTVRNIAENFRNRNIPCDVIYLDIHYMDEYRVFTWDKKSFPDPEKMLSDLKKDGFKIVPIIDPGVKADKNYFAAEEGLGQKLFAMYPDGEVYQGEVWPSWSYFPDFTKKETRDWWGDKLSVLLKQGIEGFWNDMNEPAVWGQNFPDIVLFDDNGFTANHKKIHNVYALEMARATFDGLKKHSPNKRHFILTRAGFAGIQRYSAVWTGDNVANNDHLVLALTMPLGMGLSGIPFAGSDVGGFMGVPSPRLFTRWMQLGAFTPFLRGHSHINEKAKEPWAFGEETEELVRNAITQRYKTLPYLYNLFFESSQTGAPVMRPMFYEFQDDEECYSHYAQYQFMFGKDILVAPVLNDYENFKKIYLPEGKWYSIFEDKVYQGGQWIIVEAPISQIPVFMKDGSILPTIEVQNYVGEKKIDQLELTMFATVPASLQFYEDDGISYDYQKDKYSLTDFKFEPGIQKSSLKIRKIKNDYNTGRKNYLIGVIKASRVLNISCNDKVLQSFNSRNDLLKTDEGYFYSDKLRMLYIKVKDSGDINIDISNYIGMDE